jgi:hypothetical protein
LRSVRISAWRPRSASKSLRVFALSLHGLDGAVRAAAFRHLSNRPVDLGKPGVHIGERMGLCIDPSG